MKTVKSLKFILVYLITIALISPIAKGEQISDDLSQKGKLTVEVIEFRDLWDKTREKVVKRERFRLFKRNQPVPDQSQGRKIPIKVHAPTLGGPYPVVIISHGAGGNWDTHYAQANHLASQGYIVLCLEHVGSNTERLKSSFRVLHNLKEMIHDSNEVLGRPKDISFAIDQAVAWNTSNEKLRGRIDLNHIGIMGHSFGAYTTMVVAGMRPALNWLEPTVAPGSGLGPNLSENRIQCGIALSPQSPGEPFFINESFSSLRVPLLGISGTNDKQQSGEPPISRYESFKLWPSMGGKNIFLWLTNAGHLDFTDSTGGDQHGMKSSSRADVQKIVRAASLKFFNSCLKDDKSPESNLNIESMKKYLGGSINNLEVLSK
jgi:dienelactone hydrolase